MGVTAEFIGGHTDVLSAGPTIFGDIEEMCCASNVPIQGLAVCGHIEFIGGHTDVLTAGPTIFGDIEEKLDVLRVECTDPRSCRLRAYRM
jgi:hypothetical protein